jgi:hypothetical protein
VSKVAFFVLTDFGESLAAKKRQGQAENSTHKVFDRVSTSLVGKKSLPDSFSSPGIEPPKLTKWRRAQELREHTWQEEKREAERNGANTGLRIDADSQLREALRVSVAESYSSFEQRRKAEHALADYMRSGLATDYGLSLPFDERESINDQAFAHTLCRVDAVTHLYDDNGSVARQFAAGDGVDAINAASRGQLRTVQHYQHKCSKAKYCPDEARAEGRRLYRYYTQHAIRHLNRGGARSVQFGVLTVSNVPFSGLEQAKQEIHARFNRIKTHFPQLIGALVTTECPMGLDGKTWNLHMNVLMLLEGRFDWESWNAMWGEWCHFTSWREMRKKTIEKLRRNGASERDIAKLTDEQVLENAFRELCKYVSKIVGEKKHTIYGHARESKPMTQWNFEQFVEWRQAMTGYRRTRGYGVLFDAGNSLWTGATIHERDQWLARTPTGKALNEIEYSATLELSWIQKGKRLAEQCLAVGLRDELRAVMFEDDRLDGSKLFAAGVLSFYDDGHARFKVGAAVTPVSLIQDYKSGGAESGPVDRLPVSVREKKKMDEIFRQTGPPPKNEGYLRWREDKRRRERGR